MIETFAAALFGTAPPAGLTTDPSRFAVYRNNVHVALIRALQARFPVTEAVTGAEFFRAMARAYLRQHPPVSPVLHLWGESFPDFAATFPGAETLPWLPDLARLEAAWTRAYHAADAPPLQLADLATLTSPVLHPHPALQLVVSDWPVGTIWAAHSGGPRVTEAQGAEVILVTRPGLQVQVQLLPPADLPFLRALLDGESLEAAAPLAPDFGRALTGLVALGAFTKGDPA